MNGNFFVVFATIPLKRKNVCAILYIRGDYMPEYEKTCHSVFSLTYHLVICVKYRKKIINIEIGSLISTIAIQVATVHSISILEYNFDKDHVHFLLKASPSSNLTRFIAVLKSRSSKSKLEKSSKR